MFAMWSVRAQGVPPPVAFEWDAPTNMLGVVGYRIEWGPQDRVDLPVHQTLYAVDSFPTGLLLPVSVYSLSSTTNSEPETIHVFNVTVAIEESTDLATWQPVATVLVRGQRKPVSFLRLKLEPADGN